MIKLNFKSISKKLKMQDTDFCLKKKKKQKKNKQKNKTKKNKQKKKKTRKTYQELINCWKLHSKRLLYKSSKTNNFRK